MLLEWASFSSLNHIWKHLKASWELCSRTRQLLNRATRSGCIEELTMKLPKGEKKRSFPLRFDQSWGLFVAAVYSVKLLSSGTLTMWSVETTWQAKSDSTALIRPTRAWKLYGINGLRWDHGYAPTVSRGSLCDKYWERAKWQMLDVTAQFACNFDCDKCFCIAFANFLLTIIIIFSPKK